MRARVFKIEADLPAERKAEPVKKGHNHATFEIPWLLAYKRGGSERIIANFGKHVAKLPHHPPLPAIEDADAVREYLDGQRLVSLVDAGSFKARSCFRSMAHHRASSW